MSVVIGGTSGPSLAGSLEPVAFTGSMSATRPYRNSAGDHLSQNLHHAQGQHRFWVASVGASPDADMCPASDAANFMPQPLMALEGRVQIKAACTKALYCALALPILFHDWRARLLLALRRSDVLTTGGRLPPPRPETGRRRPWPSGPGSKPRRPLIQESG